MNSLTALADCLAQALHGVCPAPVERLPLPDACGHVLAEDLAFAADSPRLSEALRAGLAVAALDLMGASPQAPVPLGDPARVLPGDAMPPDTDAVLPEDGAECGPAGWEAVRAISPGEGMRRAGHDGRAGAAIARAGTRLTALQGLAARLGGVERCLVRRPRVAIRVSDPALAAFAGTWVTDLGARISEESPHLVLHPADDRRPRLALAPGETAWIDREGGALVLCVPQRFDGALAALLALGLPALALLSGASLAAVARPLTRKASAALGLSDLMLLRCEGAAWHPASPGTITLSVLATADAFAILPPDSEGLPEGAVLPATPLRDPFAR